jgi:hypothetical protein
LALARADGEPLVVCDTLAFMIYRSELSNSARRSFDGTTLG